jgi:hypothetical protein
MKPKGVMVWLGYGYNFKLPAIFLDKGVKMNAEIYRQQVTFQWIPSSEE